MVAAPKRGRAGGGSSDDRLGALTDELLGHVLSFLPSRQAVQTTVLSKRWVDLWRTVPAINLKPCDFGEYPPGHSRWKKMKDFTNELLMFHNAECLDAFRLTFLDYYFDPDPDVNRWIRRAVRYNPLVLEIWVNSSSRYHFHIPRVSTFNRLKKLYLGGVRLDPSFAECVKSGCPFLEDLLLVGCSNEFDSIQSNTLKNLDVANCSSQIADVLVVRAPCLDSLCLGFTYYNYENGLSLVAGNSISWATISVSDISPRCEARLLGSLYNVRSLELTGFSAMAILDKELDKFLTFGCLRTLCLDRCFGSERGAHTIEVLGRLLKKSPNLEKLTLKNFRVAPVAGSIEFPVLKNLRTLLLDRCDLRDNYRLLRHCLRNSASLERLTIRLCEAPAVSTGGKGRTKSKKMYSHFQNLMRFQCQKLKHTKVIYKEGGEIQGLVGFFLGISDCAPKNTITLTKYEEVTDDEDQKTWRNHQPDAG